MILIYIICKKDKTLWKRTALLIILPILVFGLILVTNGNSVVNRINKIISEGQQIISSQSLSDEMGSGRIMIWKMIVTSIINHPLIGSGPDCILQILKDEQLHELYMFYSKYGTVVDKAHNEYLQIAATMGIPALILYILAIASILEPNIKNMFKSKLSYIFVISITAYLIQAFFNISVIMVAPIFWFILGLSNNKDFKEKMDKEL